MKRLAVSIKNFLKSCQIITGVMLFFLLPCIAIANPAGGAYDPATEQLPPDVFIEGIESYFSIDKTGFTIDDTEDESGQYLAIRSRFGKDISPDSDWWVSLQLKVINANGPRPDAMIASSISDGKSCYSMYFLKDRAGIGAWDSGFYHKMDTTDGYHVYTMIKDMKKSLVILMVDGVVVGSLPFDKFSDATNKTMAIIFTGSLETAIVKVNRFAYGIGTLPEDYSDPISSSAPIHSSTSPAQNECPVSIVMEEPDERMVYHPNERVLARIVPERIPMAKEVFKWTLFDYDYNILKEGSIEIEAGQKEVLIDVTPGRKGFFYLKLDNSDGNDQIYFSVWDVPLKHVKDISETWPLGICTYMHIYSRDYVRDNDITYDKVKKRISLIASAGFKHLRVPFYWFMYEPEEGKYLFPDPTTGEERHENNPISQGYQIRAAEELGMNVLGWDHGWAPLWALRGRDATHEEKEIGWVWNDVGKSLNVDLDAQQRYFEKLAGHFKGKIQSWELGNEMDGLSKSALELMPQIQTANLGVRIVDPQVSTSHFSNMHAPSGNDKYGLNLYGTFIGLGIPYFDLSNWHLYPWGSPETFVGGFKSMESSFASNAGGSFGGSSWQSESAFNSNYSWNGGVGMANQANFYARVGLITYQASRMDYDTKYFQYLEIDDEPFDATSGVPGGSHGFLMMNGDCKPSFGAWVFFTDFIRDSIPLGMSKLGESWVALFYSLRQGDVVGSVWNPKNKKEALSIPSGKDFICYDVFGNIAGRSSNVKVTGAPLYFRGVEKSWVLEVLSQRQEEQFQNLLALLDKQPVQSKAAKASALKILNQKTLDILHTTDNLSFQTKRLSLAKELEQLVLGCIKENEELPLTSVSPSFVMLDALRFIETVNLAAIVKSISVSTTSTGALEQVEKRLVALRQKSVEASRTKSILMLNALHRIGEFAAIARRYERVQEERMILDYADAVAHVAETVADIERPYDLRAYVRPESACISGLPGDTVTVSLEVVNKVGRGMTFVLEIPDGVTWTGAVTKPFKIEGDSRVVKTMNLQIKNDAAKGRFRIPVRLSSEGKNYAPMFLLLDIMSNIRAEVLPLEIYPDNGHKVGIRMTNRDSRQVNVKRLDLKINNWNLQAVSNLPGTIAGGESRELQFKIVEFKQDPLDIYTGEIEITTGDDVKRIPVKLSLRTERPLPGARLVDRKGWLAISSVQISVPERAFDNDRATRWDTGQPQSGGEFFMLDMGREENVVRVEMICVHPVMKEWNDYPEGLLVETSQDGKTWEPVIDIKSVKDIELDGRVVVTFTPRPGRHIKLTQTENSPTRGLYWSIYELNVYSLSQ